MPLSCLSSRLLALAAAGSAWQVLAAAEPWSTVAHDARRTCASSGSITPPLTLAWTRSDLQAQAVSADDETAYVNLADRIVAVSRTGETRWSAGTSKFFTGDAGNPTILVDADGSERGVALADNTLHIHRPDGSAVGATIPQWVGWTAYDGHRLYAENIFQWASSDNPTGLGAFDPDTGAQIWRTTVGSNGSGVLFPHGFAVDGERVFMTVGELNHVSLRAYRASDGAELWRSFGSADTVTSPGPWEGEPSAADGLVFNWEAATWQDDLHVVCRHQDDGGVVWRSAPYGQPALGHAGQYLPVIAGDLLLVVSSYWDQHSDVTTTSWTVTALSRTDGSPRWHREFATGIFDHGVIAALGSGTALVATAGLNGEEPLQVLSLATGETLWQGHPAGDGIGLGTPILVGSRLYFVARGMGAPLYAVDGADASVGGSGTGGTGGTGASGSGTETSSISASGAGGAGDGKQCGFGSGAVGVLVGLTAMLQRLSSPRRARPQ